MADVADVAAEREAIFLAESLARAGRAKPSGPSARYCAGCGEPIPEPRRVAVPGVELCISCQEEQDNERA